MMFSDGTFSDGMFSDRTFSDDGTFSEGMFSDGTFSDGMFLYRDLLYCMVSHLCYIDVSHFCYINVRHLFIRWSVIFVTSMSVIVVPAVYGPSYLFQYGPLTSTRVSTTLHHDIRQI